MLVVLPFGTSDSLVKYEFGGESIVVPVVCLLNVYYFTCDGESLQAQTALI